MCRNQQRMHTGLDIGTVDATHGEVMTAMRGACQPNQVMPLTEGPHSTRRLGVTRLLRRGA